MWATRPFTDVENGETVIQDFHPSSTETVTAHEVGHDLGRSGHSNNLEDLMFGFDTGADACEIRKADWDAVNP